MSRLTGNDAKEMLEAYQAVYAPQEEVELTEEQVWEEVENWVNSLLEEGYDLSEYTWEEMYEAYFQLDEAIPLAIPAAMAAAPYVLPALGAAAYTAKALMNRGKTKNTPEEERFLSTGSFAASKDAVRRGKEAAQLNRKQNQPAQPASTPVSGRTIRGENPTQPPTQPRSQDVNLGGVSTGVKLRSPGPRIEVSTPKPPETTPGQSSTSSSTSTSSTGNTGSATGGSGGRKPKPEGPNPAQQFLGSKWKEFRQSVGRGGKDSQGRGVTAAGGELAGSLVRTPIRQTLDVANKVVTPLIAPVGLSAVGGGAAWKGITDLMNPKTPAGRWIRGVREEYEIGDILINHLIEEKYAKDEKSALSIIENMSEKWAVSILENYFES